MTMARNEFGETPIATFAREAMHRCFEPCERRGGSRKCCKYCSLKGGCADRCLDFEGVCMGLPDAPEHDAADGDLFGGVGLGAFGGMREEA
jgi:hypothetical protein